MRINRKEFGSLQADFIESQDFFDEAHDLRTDIDFICHHNAYLVAGFLQRRGHESLCWVSGYYQCYETAKRIHHSWIELTCDGKTAAIFEFDPRQLHERGGYENDPMPSGHILEFSITASRIASIIDPDVVELPEEAKESRWVVSSREVLLRYIESNDYFLQINFVDLDELGVETQDGFDLKREFANENFSE